jgi:hypothetical protein
LESRTYDSPGVPADYIYLYYGYGSMSFLSIDIETKAPGYRPCAVYSDKKEACENKPGYPTCTWIHAEDELTVIAAQLTDQEECESNLALAWDIGSERCVSQSGYVCAPEEQEYIHRNEAHLTPADEDTMTAEAGSYTYMRGEWTDISASDSKHAEHWQRAQGSLGWKHAHEGIPCEIRVKKSNGEWIEEKNDFHDRHLRQSRAAMIKGIIDDEWEEVEDAHADHVDAEHPGVDCIGDCINEGLLVSNCEWERGECIQNVVGKGEKSYTPPCHYGEYLISPTMNYKFLCPIDKTNKRGEFNFIAGEGVKPKEYGPYSVRRTRKLNARKCEGDGYRSRYDEDSGRGDREAFEKNLSEGTYSPPSHWAGNMWHVEEYRQECTRAQCDHD